MRMGRRGADHPRMAIDPVTRLCRLESIAGRERACPREGCSFWEPGGAVLDGRCMFERVDLAAWPALAGDLIDIRERLDAAAGEASPD
jgi:hypothetical protein